jgi:hypothetical protein
MCGSFRWHLILLLTTAFAGPTLADMNRCEADTELIPCHGVCRTRSPAANSRITSVNARIAAAKWR